MVSYSSLGSPPPPPTVHVYKTYRNIVKPCKQRLHVLHVLVRVTTPKSRTCRHPLIRLFNIMVLKKKYEKNPFLYLVCTLDKINFKRNTYDIYLCPRSFAICFLQIC